MLVLFAFSANAQLQKRSIPEFSGVMNTDAEEITESWWGYFDGDYNSISVTGLAIAPVNYSCAIKIEAGNPDVLGKRIKAIKFAFERINYIEDVSVWISKELPNKPSKADVCYVPVDINDVKSFEADNAENVVNFPEPYQVGGSDVYVGYSFRVTSDEGDLCTYPIVVSYSTTMANAFLMNWGDGWVDNAGKNYGNLAIMLLMDDGGVFKTGDANYDTNINVIDVTNTLEYILTGNVHPFNKKSADVDGNGEINIVDVESIIDMILERYEAPADKNTDESADEVTAVNNKNGIGVSLKAEESYRGFQMDIILPEGKSIKSIDADQNVAATHNFRYTEMADGRYRVIASSLNGTSLSGNVENLFNITADTDDVKIENIIFATSDLQEKRFANIGQQDITGIESVNADNNEGNIYDVYGVKINAGAENLAKGVYVVNGKKVIIK